MRVENHTERVTKIPIMFTHEKTGHCAEVDSIVLLPGVNDVDPEKWAKVKDFEHVKLLVKLGAKRGGFVVGKPTESLATLEKLDAEDAIETVDECVDAKLLAAWRASEKRAAVLEALEKQIEKIDPRKDRATDSGFGAV